MRIRIISFTKKGYELAERIRDGLKDHEAELIHKGRTSAEADAPSSPVSLEELCRTAFEEKIPLLFVSAAGIAVRSVAPFVRDKLTDPPVIVSDELGQFVIPVLSGHAGGANRLACEIAEITGGIPVITTATDLHGVFPADVFAAENGLRIVDREGIARVAGKALEGKTITISIRNYPPEEPVDVIVTDDPAYAGLGSLQLCPKKYAVGIGCRRGKPFEELREFTERCLRENGIDPADGGVIASVRMKEDEPGLVRLAQSWRVPFLTFEPELLEKVRGKFAHSDFVLQKTGVDSVSERAAMLAAGAGALLVVPKTAENGMTAAVARVRD